LEIQKIWKRSDRILFLTFQEIILRKLEQISSFKPFCAIKIDQLTLNFENSLFLSSSTSQNFLSLAISCLLSGEEPPLANSNILMEKRS